jgi:hypothetical protein
MIFTFISVVIVTTIGFGISYLLANSSRISNKIKEYRKKKKQSKKKYTVSDLKEKLSIGTEVKLTTIPTDGIEKYLPNPNEWGAVTPYKVLSYFSVVGWHDDIMFVRMVEGIHKSVVDTSNSPLKIFIPNHPTLKNTDINEFLKVDEVLLASHDILKLVGQNAEIEVLIRSVTRTGNSTSKAAPTKKKLSANVYSFKVIDELLVNLTEHSEITYSFETEYTSKKIDIYKQQVIEMEREYLSSINSIINEDMDKLKSKV